VVTSAGATGSVLLLVEDDESIGRLLKQYLERQDGQRVFLMQYNAPIADNLGAKFIFPRLVDGQPFLKSDSGSVRFFAQFNDSFKINMVYKVREMIYEQKLEY